MSTSVSSAQWSASSTASTSANDASPARRSSINSSADGLFRKWLDMPLSLGSGRSERDLLINKMSQWLLEHDRAYYNSHVVTDIHDAIAEILDIIANLVSMLKTSNNMLAVVMLYADKFVKRSGIKHNQLFNLLLTSTVVTVKFWNESVVVSNKNIAQVFEFSLEDVNLMERRFLAGVEFGLCLNEDDVKAFLLGMLNDYHTANTAAAITANVTMVDTIKAQQQATFAVSPVPTRRQQASCHSAVAAAADSMAIDTYHHPTVAAAAQ